MHYLYDGGRWARMIGSDMDQLTMKRDRLLMELSAINERIEEEEAKVMHDVLREWTIEEIDEAKERAKEDKL